MNNSVSLIGVSACKIMLGCKSERLLFVVV